MKRKAIIGISLFLILSVFYLNWKYEVFAFHPIRSTEQPELTVMTWNVHCSDGTDVNRQKEIADLILKEDADFVLLNEYNQDSCRVTDSLLRIKYPFTEEYQSHLISGDIFYSKRKMSDSGHPYIYRLKRFEPEGYGALPDSLRGRVLRTIKATIAIGNDSVQLFGVHLASNSPTDSVINNRKGLCYYYECYKEAQRDRNFQAQWTKEYILESIHPVIVMGDMNDFNCSAPLDTLMSCGLKDSWWEGGFGYGCTFHTGWMRLRIDHILYSKELKLERVKVIDTDLSDHNPVVAGFSISK